MQRRNAIILAADVAGYARLVETDAEGTIGALMESRRIIIDPSIAEHGGNLISTAGDGLVAEFGSAGEAVTCAVALQAAMASRWAGIDPEKRLRLRVGIHAGEVVSAGAELHGEGIIIAARLESLAEPGGICLSEPILRQIENRDALLIADWGEPPLKNVSRSIRVYAITGESSGGGAGSSGMSLPGRPSIAVLPLRDLGGDPGQNYFSDGVTEDIITELSRFRALFVIDRGSSSAYAAGTAGIGTIARELGVRYLVSGSVRVAPDRVRISVHLVDAVSGQQLWAERYDCDLAQLFDVQDEVVGAIVAAVANELEEVGLQQARRHRTDSMAAYDCMLRGLELFHRHTPSEEIEARHMFERAVALDPGFALARVHLARTWLHEAFWDDSGAALERAESIARQAAALDPSEAWCHLITGIACLHRRQPEEAEAACRRAAAMNPNDAGIAARLGLVLTDLGRPHEAIQWVRRAMRLDPRREARYADYLGLAYYGARRYADAVKSFAVNTEPRFYDHAWLAAAHAHLGNVTQSHFHAGEVLRLAPDFTVGRYRRMEPYLNAADLEHWIEGLRLAGIPE